MTIRETGFSLLQYPLPHHLLSRVMHRLTRCQNTTWKNAFIKGIVKAYQVEMGDAVETNPEAYTCFNDFFTRALKPEVRPLSQERNAVLCPADGAISQIGAISGGQMLQAKGKTFNVMDLLGGDAHRAQLFENGQFATIYLSPRDYHRLHMPVAGTLKEMIHIPGRLFSVNAGTVNCVPNLFARNERVCALFETEIGPMALVLVGAIFVASIETVWHGVVTPPSSTSIRTWRYDNDIINLNRGQEMGRFNMGSTIIVLFSQQAMQWKQNLTAGEKVKMGQAIGITP